MQQELIMELITPKPNMVKHDVCPRKEDGEIDVHSMYDTIHGSINYYKSIILEGYYINQVNFELIDLLKRTKEFRSNEDTQLEAYNKYIEASAIKEAVVEDRHLNGSGYDPLKTLSRTKDGDKTYPQLTCIKDVILRALGFNKDTLVDDTKKYTLVDDIKTVRWFMIANIRPEYNRFRDGAINTLKLIDPLKNEAESTGPA